MSNPDRTDRRDDLLKWIMPAGIFVLSFVLFLHMMGNPSSDISIHAQWASEMDLLNPRTVLRHVFHPLWHVPVMMLTRLGLSLSISAALITALCKTAGTVLIRKLLQHLCGDSLSSAMLTGAALVCAIVSSVWIPVLNPNIYMGGGSPNTWHSPTQLMCIPFMISGIWLVSRLFDTFRERLIPLGSEACVSWKEAVPMGAVLLLSLTAKPVFMQAFLPAACLFFGIKWIRYPRNSRFFLRILACVAPSILFMLLQMVYYFDVPSQSTMAVGFSAERLQWVLRYGLMLLFPLWVLITVPGRRDTLTVLTVLYAAAAFLELALMCETGQRASDGNFGWACLAASLMVWTVTMGLFLKDASGVLRERGRLLFRHRAGIVLLAWHFFSGVYYIFYLFTSGASC